MWPFKKRKAKKPEVAHVPLYVGYDGRAYEIKKMSDRHLRNAINGFRRKGYVTTGEYKYGINRPMSILDFLERELAEREKSCRRH